MAPDSVDRRPLIATPLAELRQWLTEHGEPAGRTQQIWHWIGQRRATDFAVMTDLPQRLRDALHAEWQVFGTQVVRQTGDIDATVKLLLGLRDGKTVECVLLSEENRRTVCLSTQVGCGMGCVFCASGLGGVERNLTTGEMLEELIRLRNLLPEEERLSHIVVMGMGEPLANLDALLPALAFASSPKGLGISARNITVSTVGLPAKIRQLAEVGKPYHLAVSLHAPNNRLRRRIVPTAEKILLEDIIAAADVYRETTRRQVTFEYVLLRDVNDDVTHARELADLLRGRDPLINVIPYNPVAGLPWDTPLPGKSKAFAEVLRAAGFVTKIRKRKGGNIDAACGQLRREHEGLVSHVGDA